MFDRPHHRRIAAVLEALDADEHLTAIGKMQHGIVAAGLQVSDLFYFFKTHAFHGGQYYFIAGRFGAVFARHHNRHSAHLRFGSVGGMGACRHYIQHRTYF